MKKILVLATLAAAIVFAANAEARGSFSSGGRGFSGGGYRAAAPAARPAPAFQYRQPAAAPRQSFGYQQPRQVAKPTPQVAPQRPTQMAAAGGFGGGGRGFSSGGAVGGGGRGFNSGAAPAARPAPQARTTTTTTTTRTTSSSYRSYSGRNVGNFGGCMGCGMMYGGWGMGYGYMNGMLTGLIIGNMMHPNGTVMYTGGGMYSNNALLYPSGAVVDQSGHQVGTYVNGAFTPMANGPMVAQSVPADAVPGAPVVQPAPVIIQTGPTPGEVFGVVILVLLCVILFAMLLAAL